MPVRMGERLVKVQPTSVYCEFDKDLRHVSFDVLADTLDVPGLRL